MGLVTGISFLAGIVIPQAFASDFTDATKILAGSPALELPARAAGIVAKASAVDKQAAAAAAVKAAVGVNPAASAAIVSAVARENPAAAPVAAVTAATLQHKQIGLIAKAAAAAAPAEAAKVVAALIKEFPRDYGTIAIAADEGAPLSGRDILDVVADFVPALQPSIHAATVNYAANDGNVPVQAILTQSYNQALTSGAVASTQVPPALLGQSSDQTVLSGAAAPARTPAPAATAPVPNTTAPARNAPATVATPALFSPPLLSAPVLGPPFTPVGPVINNFSPIQTTPQQPGGRNYASP